MAAHLQSPTQRDLLCLHQGVRRFRRLVEPDPPANFLWVYSYDGTQDHLLDPDTDRVADVFPDEQAITAAGWSSQEASDLLAVLGPRLVGIPANRIPHFLHRLRAPTVQPMAKRGQHRRAARRQHAGGPSPTGLDQADDTAA